MSDLNIDAKDHWYCDNCGQLDPKNVTYFEKCHFCGEDVSTVEAIECLSCKELQAEVEMLRKESLEWKEQADQERDYAGHCKYDEENALNEKSRIAGELTRVRANYYESEEQIVFWKLKFKEALGLHKFLEAIGEYKVQRKQRLNAKAEGGE